MAAHNVPNYIRRFRKQLGLTQQEVAFLLGGRGASQPSRYEHFSRTPSLRKALGLAAIFGVSVSDLFSAQYEKAIGETARQAKRLIEQLENSKSEIGASGSKLEFLKALIARAQVAK